MEQTPGQSCGRQLEIPTAPEAPIPAIQALAAAAAAATPVAAAPQETTAPEDATETPTSTTLTDLDPKDHALISDPLVRPAKRHSLVPPGNHANPDATNGNQDGTTNTGRHQGSSDRRRPRNGPQASREDSVAKGLVDFSESILSRLFEPDRKQKPKLWEFVRLVAPGPTNKPPKGQYKWRSKDAVAAYCLRCKIAFTYTPGTSKTITRHLTAYHGLKGSRNNRCSRVPKKVSQNCDSIQIVVPAPIASAPTQSQKNARTHAPPKSKPVRKRSLKYASPITTTREGEGKDMDTPIGGGSICDSSSDSDCSIAVDDASIPSQVLPTSQKKRCRGENSQTRTHTRLESEVFCRKRSREEDEGSTRGESNVVDLPTSEHDDGDCDDDDDGNDIEEDTFLVQGCGMNRKAVITKALFRWWLGSNQSLVCYQTSTARSLFVRFCQTLDDSFELPEPSIMESLASTSYERLQNEIQMHAYKLFPTDLEGNLGGTMETSSTSLEFVCASVRRVRVVRLVAEARRAKPTTIEGEDDKDLFRDNAGKGEGNEPPTGRDCEGTEDKARDESEKGLPGDWVVDERTFYPVRLTFCTPMFRMKSYVIGVIPADNDGGEAGKVNTGNGRIFSPYSRAVDLAMQSYGFPRDNLSCTVIRGSYQEVEAGISDSYPETREFLCILDRLDTLVARVFRSSAILSKDLQKLLSQLTVENTNMLTSPKFSTVRAFKILTDTLSNDTMECESFYPLIAYVLDVITPFRDAIQTLSEDSHPTIGLAIPVLRRVRNILLRQQNQRRKTSDNPSEKSSSSVDGHASTFGPPIESLEIFHLQILEDFETTFSSILNGDPTFLWTVPLDPRLIAMRGFSESEQSKAKSMLIEQVSEFVEVIDRRKDLEQKQKTSNSMTNKGFRDPAASTMNGIFWGEDSNPTTKGKLDRPFNRINAREYATKNVNSYFNMVHSQRHIKDPLSWWKNNHYQFPELAMLARKWMSSSTVYGRKNTRDNECASVLSTPYFDTKDICRMIFLHDNNNLI